MQVAAQNCTIILLGALILFHLCVLAKWIPHTMVWGSRIKTNRELYVFETISLLVTGFFLLVTLSKAGYVGGILPANSLAPLWWVMAAVFVMNGIGNMLSKNVIEQRIFGPVALLLAVLAWVSIG
jgi:hypothetical protein